VNVSFSELAEAGMRTWVKPESLGTSRTHLAFYLRRGHADTSIPLLAFEDVSLFVYRFGPYRVIYEVKPSGILVWSFTVADALDAN
jgi:hypothetical protein